LKQEIRPKLNPVQSHWSSAGPRRVQLAVYRLELELRQVATADLFELLAGVRFKREMYRPLVEACACHPATVRLAAPPSWLLARAVLGLAGTQPCKLATGLRSAAR